MSVEANGSRGQKGKEPIGLPLRWLVILSIAAAAGLGVGMAAGLPYGVGTALAAVGLSHRIVS